MKNITKTVLSLFMASSLSFSGGVNQNIYEKVVDLVKKEGVNSKHLTFPVGNKTYDLRLTGTSDEGDLIVQEYKGHIFEQFKDRYMDGMVSESDTYLYSDDKTSKFISGFENHKEWKDISRDYDLLIIKLPGLYWSSKK